MAWTTLASVRERVRQATATFDWDDPDVTSRMTRAVTVLSSKLVPHYGTTEVASWDVAVAIPALIESLAADQAAVYILQDGWGQSPNEPGTPGGNLQEGINNTLDELFAGKTDLLDSSGDVISRVDTGRSRLKSTTQDKEPVFTMGNRVQDTSRKGTLDGF